MSRGRRTIVTILGASYFQPIADLLEQWLTQGRPRPNRVQSGHYEAGYAASCVLLLVAMFESYVSRLRFVRGATMSATLRTAIEVVDAAFSSGSYGCPRGLRYDMEDTTSV
jgi:hypothetical protein